MTSGKKPDISNEGDGRTVLLPAFTSGAPTLAWDGSGGSMDPPGRRGALNEFMPSECTLAAAGEANCAKDAVGTTVMDMGDATASEGSALLVSSRAGGRAKPTCALGTSPPASRDASHSSSHSEIQRLIA